MKAQNQDILVSCNKCTAKVPITQTTYDQGGKNLICFECYNKLAKGLEPEPYKTLQSAEYPKRISYTCSHCHFKCSRTEDFVFNGLCVNCGRRAVQTEEKQFVLKDRKSLLDY